MTKLDEIKARNSLLAWGEYRADKYEVAIAAIEDRRWLLGELERVTVNMESARNSRDEYLAERDECLELATKMRVERDAITRKLASAEGLLHNISALMCGGDACPCCGVAATSSAQAIRAYFASAGAPIDALARPDTRSGVGGVEECPPRQSTDSSAGNPAASLPIEDEAEHLGELASGRATPSASSSSVERSGEVLSEAQVAECRRYWTQGWELSLCDSLEALRTAVKELCGGLRDVKALIGRGGYDSWGTLFLGIDTLLDKHGKEG